MPTRKKRAKQTRQVQPAELVKLAEDHLNRGQIDEAIQNLRLVEKEVQHRVTADGKKISTPPHLVAIQAVTPPLLARAFSARSLNTADPKQKLEDLEVAVTYAPEEIRYRIAIGACRLLLGQSEAARSDFEKAEIGRSETETRGPGSGCHICARRDSLSDRHRGVQTSSGAIRSGSLRF